MTPVTKITVIKEAMMKIRRLSLVLLNSHLNCFHFLCYWGSFVAAHG